MDVHERSPRSPIEGMEIAHETLFGDSDAEWVADLLDTVALADLETTAEALEDLARRLRKAAKAKKALMQVPTQSLKAGIDLRTERRCERGS